MIGFLEERVVVRWEKYVCVCVCVCEVCRTAVGCTAKKTVNM